MTNPDIQPGVDDEPVQGAVQGAVQGRTIVSAPVRRIVRFAHTSTGATVPGEHLPRREGITREWAWGGSTGAGVRVCVIDSGIDASHPLVGGAVDCYAVTATTAKGVTTWNVEADDAGDLAGHGTACGGIIRKLAPACGLTSVRILGPNLRARGDALVTAVEWAVRERFPIVNLSLSTQRTTFKERLHDLADEAYFTDVTLVSSAHNSPLRSYPWRFSAAVSVGAHAVPNSEHIEYNPAPPVDFFAAGVNVLAPWPGGGTRRFTGNSFATAHISGLCARILQLHPGFRTAQLKHVLAAVADNIA